MDEAARELAAARTLENLARIAIKHVAETFASRVVALKGFQDGSSRNRDGQTRSS